MPVLLTEILFNKKEVNENKMYRIQNGKLERLQGVYKFFFQTGLILTPL